MPRIPLHAIHEAARNFTQRPPDRDGLGIDFFIVDDERVEATWRVTDRLEGWRGLLHGGGITALHDDAAGWAMVALAGRTGFTTRMDVAFQRPVPIGSEVTVVGRVGEVGQRRGTFPSKLRLADGTVASTATTEFAFVEDERLAAMLDVELSDELALWLAASPEERVALVRAAGRARADAG